VAQVQTVLGPVPAEELGVTLSHVHLTLDIRCWHAPPQDPELRAVADEPLGLGNLWLARRNGLAVRDNLLQHDLELTLREVAGFRRAGGGALVDMELPGIGRDVEALRRIARETGLHVVASTGFYTQASHPREVAGADVDALAEGMVRELEEGIGPSGVRAGNIGEIGCSGMPDQAFLPDEEKVLRAAARAQARTGVSLTVHPNHGTHGTRERPQLHLHTYLDVLEKEGADLEKVYLSHMGYVPFEETVACLDRGLGFVSFDHFGHEEYYEVAGPGRQFPRDKEEVELVLRLLEAGHGDRVLVGNEVGWKTCYRAYGGFGYGHVLEHVVPWLRDCGASEADLQQVLVGNPARLHGVG